MFRMRASAQTAVLQHHCIVYQTCATLREGGREGGEGGREGGRERGREGGEREKDGGGMEGKIRNEEEKQKEQRVEGPGERVSGREGEARKVSEA